MNSLLKYFYMAGFKTGAGKTHVTPDCSNFLVYIVLPLKNDENTVRTTLWKGLSFIY